MKTKNKKLSPFKLMCKIIGAGWLLSLAVGCYLFVTSANEVQATMALVVGALMCLLSLVIGFYLALLYQQKRDSDWLRSSRKAIHYPASMDFHIRAGSVQGEVRKYRPRV